MKRLLLLFLALCLWTSRAVAQVGEFMIENFDGQSHMPFSSAVVAGGTFTPNINNPVPVGINTSPKVGRYNRNPGVFYDYCLLTLDGNGIGINNYTAGTKQMSCKIWTDAPAGTRIEITLNNRNQALAGYPTGRHSNYYAVTTTSMNWETLVFTFAFRPDGAVSDNVIDEMTFAFAQPSNTGNVFYVDDIAGFDVQGAVVTPTITDEYLWTDFVGSDPAFSVGATGTLSTAANPNTGGAVPAATVGKYDRSGIQYDNFVLDFNGVLQNLPDYKLNLRKFSLNIYSPAPGTTVEFVLQNRGMAQNAFPTGRYANFTGSTVGTGWEKVVLSYQGSPDAGVQISEVNEMAVLINGGISSPTTVYLDSLFGPTIGPGPVLGQYAIHNFDGINNMTFVSGETDGTFTNNFNNPSVDAGNGSAKVGRYVRNAGVQFDVLTATLNGKMLDVASYIAGTKKFTMKVRTDAPAGSVIELTLSTPAGLSGPSGNYPTGRHSVFRAYTTASNTWETLTFTYFYNPNAGASIDNLQKVFIGFKANSFTNNTWYFDDFQGTDLQPLVGIPNRDKLWSALGGTGSSNYLYYSGADGALTKANNPGSVSYNNQPEVARYLRSGVQYDVLRFKMNAPPTNLPAYRSGSKEFSINMYSPAIGTRVQFTLQNATLALGGYPSGRAAEFLGVTTTVGWEHVNLVYNGQPDPSVTDANVNELAILFNSNTFSPTTVYADSIFGPQFTPVAVSASTAQWTGAADQNWGNASNWSSLLPNWYPGFTLGAGAVPTSTVAVTIPATAQAPLLTGTFSCSNLTLEANANPSIASGGVLNVSGNITGVASASVGGTGKINMNGNTRQFIYGVVNVSNLELNNTSPQGVFMPGVTSTLRIKPVASSGSGIFKLNGSSYFGNYLGGKVILASNAFGTGKLVSINPGATYDGVLTQERYLSGGGWHFVGAPFLTGATLADWSEAQVRISPKNNANLFEYTEPDTTRGRYNGYLTEVNGWKVPSALSNTVNNGNAPKGYRLYANSSFIGSGGVLSVTGQPMRNNVTAFYTFTPNGGYNGGGWNLIANPYPCDIDWAQTAYDASVGNTVAPMSKAVSIWNASTNVYATFTATSAAGGVGVNGATQYIPSSQAFFIRASGGGSVTFTELQKTANNGSFLRGGEPENVLRVKLSQGTQADEAAVLLHDDAAAGRDRIDADNLGTNLDVYFRPVGGLNLAIAAYPALTAQVEMPVVTSGLQAGTATLNLSGIESFAQGVQAYLRDAFLNTLTPITSQTVYTFSVTSNPATQGARFSIVLSPSNVTGVKGMKAAQLIVAPNPAKDRVEIAPSTGTLKAVQVLDVVGRVVYSWTGAQASHVVETSGWAAGIYTVQAVTSEGDLRTKLKKE